MKKLIVIISLLFGANQLRAQENHTNLHSGFFGEGIGVSLMLEQDLLHERGLDLYLRGGFSWLVFGYGIPHGISICKGEENQIELGVSGIFSSTEEFLGSRAAKEYHLSPLLGYRSYMESRKAFFRIYLNPMLNISNSPRSYGLFNGNKLSFMAGISVGFKLR